MRVTTRCIVSSNHQVMNSSFIFATSLKMQRNLRCRLPRWFRAKTPEPLREQAMKVHALSSGEPPIEYLTVRRVAELIFQCQLSVGQFVRPQSLQEQLPIRTSGALLFYVCCVPGHHRSDRPIG